MCIYMLPFQFDKMPTLILLDVSLSMCRPVSSTDESSDEYQRLNLGIHGINTLLDYCAAKNKQEFISLVCMFYLNYVLTPIV